MACVIPIISESSSDSEVPLEPPLIPVNHQANNKRKQDYDEAEWWNSLDLNDIDKKSAEFFGEQKKKKPKNLLKTGKDVTVERLELDYAKKLEKLNSDYYKSLAELENWKRLNMLSIEREAKDTPDSLGITLIKKWKDQDSATTGPGHYACSFIAVAGLAKFMEKDASPKEIDWNQLIEYAAQAWKVWRRGNAYNMPTPLQVYNIKRMKYLKTVISPLYESIGNLDDKWVSDARVLIPQIGDAVSTLNELLTDFVNKGKKLGAVFTTRKTTILILYNPNAQDGIWCFDSHSNNTIPGTNKSSTLAQCRDVDALESFIRKLFKTIATPESAPIYNETCEANRFDFNVFIGQ